MQNFIFGLVIGYIIGLIVNAFYAANRETRRMKEDIERLYPRRNRIKLGDER